MADALSDLIRRVLREAPFAMRQLAEDAGLSYDVLRSWRSGRRRPSRGSAARLAAGLEERGQRLLLLARELKVASETEPTTRSSSPAGAPSGGTEAADAFARGGSAWPERAERAARTGDGGGEPGRSPSGDRPGDHGASEPVRREQTGGSRPPGRDWQGGFGS